MPAEKITGFTIILIFILLLGLTVSCSLIPKNVEFFQDRVKQVPEKSVTTVEREKQAAEFVDRRVNQAKDAAIEEHSSTNIISPLLDASIASDALKLSLGAPAKLWDDSSERLAADLRREIARLDKKLEAYKKSVEPNVGKKIEGSGLISMGYFSYLAIFFGILLVLSTAIKIYGMINPVVGLAGNAAKIPVKLLGQGFKQIISAGEAFKSEIDKKIADPATKELILDIFKASHERKQDEQVQSIIKDLTKKV